MCIRNGTYVVGDIHGHYDEWIELKSRIEKDDPNAKFILLGDIEDRGPKSFEMIEWAMNNITKDGKYQMVIGNHELIKIQWIQKIKRWMLCNGLEVINLKEKNYPEEQYNFEQLFIDRNLGFEDIEKVTNWFNSLDYYKCMNINGQNFIIAHANIPYSMVDYEKSIIKDKLDRFQKEYIVWNRDVDGFDKLADTILINGHCPTVLDCGFPFNIKYTKDMMGKAFYSANRINIDCGLAYRKYYPQGNLLALRLDDLKEIYLYD